MTWEDKGAFGSYLSILNSEDVAARVRRTSPRQENYVFSRGDSNHDTQMNVLIYTSITKQYHYIDTIPIPGFTSNPLPHIGFITVTSYVP